MFDRDSEVGVQWTTRVSLFIAVRLVPTLRRIEKCPEREYPENRACAIQWMWQFPCGCLSIAVPAHIFIGLGEDMVADGYSDVLGVDFSSIVIRANQQRYKDTMGLTCMAEPYRTVLM